MFLIRFFRRGASESSLVHSETPKNEVSKISAAATLARIAAVAAGGFCFNLALPPVNAGFLGFAALVPLFLVIANRSALIGGLYGFLWGLAWAFPSFFWLREIEWFVPYLIAPVLALWPAIWGATTPFAVRNFLYPAAVQLEGEEAMSDCRKIPLWRFVLLALGLSGWFVVLEYTRSTMLPWNNLATTMWRSGFFIELTPYTGQYGISFLIAATSIAFALALKFHRSSCPAARAALVVVAALLALAPAAARVANAGRAKPETTRFRVGVVQGDISQRRNANLIEAGEALDIYLDLTEKLLRSDAPVDLVVWPESAVPVPLKANHPISEKYRRGVADLLRRHRVPMLIGTTEFALKVRDEKGYPGLTNSALLLSAADGEIGRYDKIHRVPFGEYIPFRRFLHPAVIRLVDMNRDLLPGKNYAPLTAAPDVRIGVAICFESVFPYIAREEARRGANLLLAISNDAWYPTSCEPEQHLANAIMRAAETGLPVVRSGNNGGSLVISPESRIERVLPVPGDGRPEKRRGRGYGILEVEVPKQPAMTFYTRFGDWLIVLAALGFAALLAECGRVWLKKKMLLQAMEQGAD
jgi:apolipoprotein N-acyltransferase